MSSTIEKVAVWASEHLSVEEEGMLYTLHPHLTPPRYTIAFTHARASNAAERSARPFASTLATFAKIQVRLDELTRSLPEEEQQAFTLSLLGEEDSRSLLRHLLTTSCRGDDGTDSTGEAIEPTP